MLWLGLPGPITQHTNARPMAPSLRIPATPSWRLEGFGESIPFCVLLGSADLPKNLAKTRMAVMRSLETPPIF